MTRGPVDLARLVWAARSVHRWVARSPATTLWLSTGRGRGKLVGAGNVGTVVT